MPRKRNNNKWKLCAPITRAGALPHTCNTPMLSQNGGTEHGTLQFLGPFAPNLYFSGGNEA
eukprot:6102543-Heterocapsa_arctica.AAC.1